MSSVLLRAARAIASRHVNKTINGLTRDFAAMRELSNHYDMEESDEDDQTADVSESPPPISKKRGRKVIEDEDDEDISPVDDSNDQSSEQPAEPDSEPAVISPSKSRKRVTAAPPSSSKQPAKKSKLTSSDSKNTPSIMSFFGGKPAAKPQPISAEPAKPSSASFFEPKKPSVKTNDELATTKDDQSSSQSNNQTIDGSVTDVQPDDSANNASQSSTSSSDHSSSSSSSSSRSSKSSTASKKSSSPTNDKPKPEAKAAPKPRAKPAAKSTTKSKVSKKAVSVDDDDDVGMDPADAAEIAEKEALAIEDEDALSGDEEIDETAEAAELAQAAVAKKPVVVANSSSKLGSGNYDPIADAGWNKGDPVPYSALCAMFEVVESNASRLAMISVCSDFLRSVIALTPDDLLYCVYMCCNEIAPAYEGVVMGIGDFILKKAIADTCGLSTGDLNKVLKDHADLGELAMKLRKRQNTLSAPLPLTVRGVFKNLRSMADMKGKEVNTKKEGVVKKMMVACKGAEAKFLIRALAGNLRIKMAERTVVSALARACVLTPPASSQEFARSQAGKKKQSKISQSGTLVTDDGNDMIVDTRELYTEQKFQSLLSSTLKALSQAYIEVPNHDLVISTILEHGIEELEEHCFLQPGIPVKCMLGKPTTGITQILERFQDELFTLEFKYDGERAQIHRLKDGTIKIFSRNSEDNTGKYPDLIKKLPAAMNSPNIDFIIDCECLAWDKVNKKILPFQTLTTRKRKDVKEEDITVTVVLFAFDLLFLNGKSYLNEPFRVRRDALHANFHAVEGEFGFAESKDTSDVEEIASFLQLAVESSCEGLMVKALDKDATYVPAQRNWLKVKKDYLEGVGDTLDLVPIAAFYGKGKRTGVYGAYLLASYDEESEQYQSITKIGTGFSDEDLAQRAAFYNVKTDENGEPVQRVLDKCPSEYALADSMRPDVFLAPCQVWEVKCADLSISPVHMSAVGKVDPAKGIALRFPRFMRVRPDKAPEQATSAEQVVSLYENQSVVKANSKGKKKQQDEDDW